MDELGETGVEIRPRLPLPGKRELSGPKVLTARAAAPLSKILEPIEIDPLTVADDASFPDRMAGQRNLPDFIKHELKRLY